MPLTDVQSIVLVFAIPFALLFFGLLYLTRSKEKRWHRLNENQMRANELLIDYIFSDRNKRER